jgi:hypothetical protein
MPDIDPQIEPQPVEPMEIVEETTQPVVEVVSAPIAEPVTVAEATAAVAAHKRPRTVYGGMWGPVEIGSVAVSALALLLAVIVYFALVVPSNRELAHNKSEVERLTAEQLSASSKYGEITDTQSQVNKLLTSVDDFETRFLPTISNGQSALYQRLNGLIRGYGLVNTTGPDYAPLETVDKNESQSNDEKGRSKFRSLYPGVYVSMTVEGTYQNLRRFIREIETGNEFIVISAVELAPSDNEGQQQPGGVKPPPINKNQIKVGPDGKLVQAPNPAVPVSQPVERAKGKAHGEYLALHLEMAAYFRRPGFVPFATDSVQQ